MCSPEANLVKPALLCDAQGYSRTEGGAEMLPPLEEPVISIRY